MADAKISALTNLTAADAINDMIPIVDVSDTPPASGNTKRISINNILSSSPTASGALTVTGLVTAGSATITGDLTVDTSTLKVDSTNNRVGIGTASPTVPLYVTGNNATATAIMQDETNGAKLRLLANSINFDITNGGGGGDIAVSGANPLTFRTNGTERARLNSTGAFVLAGGTTTANGIGVAFPATQSASSDANCLDDYEEGTFTPTLQFSGLSVGVTYSTRTGIYTKVGRIVHFSGRIDLSSKGTSVGDATIAGLPFAANTGAASVGYQSSIAPSDKQAILTIDTSSLIVRYASGTTTAASTDTNFSNSSILIFAGTYAI